MNKSQLIEAILAANPEATGLKRMKKAELEIQLEAIEQAGDFVEPSPEVEPELTDAQKRQRRFERASKSMRATMKITDRRLLQIDEAGQVVDEWKNSNRAYKAGVLTASQGDRVTKVLLDAFKAGDAAKVEVGAFTWVLAQQHEAGEVELAA